jgi:hypothetical protein
MALEDRKPQDEMLQRRLSLRNHALMNLQPSPLRRPWEKVLWRRQPYPDNHVPPTFLEELKKLRRFLRPTGADPSPTTSASARVAVLRRIAGVAASRRHRYLPGRLLFPSRRRSRCVHSGLDVRASRRNCGLDSKMGMETSRR